MHARLIRTLPLHQNQILTPTSFHSVFLYRRAVDKYVVMLKNNLSAILTTLINFLYSTSLLENKGQIDAFILYIIIGHFSLRDLKFNRWKTLSICISHNRERTWRLTKARECKTQDATRPWSKQLVDKSKCEDRQNNQSCPLCPNLKAQIP